ncbi:MAG: hypothetical protein AAF533_15750 [Acidobacteriota bacterium]
MRPCLVLALVLVLTPSSAWADGSVSAAESVNACLGPGSMQVIPIVNPIPDSGSPYTSNLLKHVTVKLHDALGCGGPVDLRISFAGVVIGEVQAKVTGNCLGCLAAIPGCNEMGGTVVATKASPSQIDELVEEPACVQLAWPNYDYVDGMNPNLPGENDLVIEVINGQLCAQQAEVVLSYTECDLGVTDDFLIGGLGRGLGLTSGADDASPARTAQLMLPAELGGFLEVVRDAVDRDISRLQDAGCETGRARRLWRRGNRLQAREHWGRALDTYARAYRVAVSGDCN